VIEAAVYDTKAYDREYLTRATDILRVGTGGPWLEDESPIALPKSKSDHPTIPA